MPALGKLAADPQGQSGNIQASVVCSWPPFQMSALKWSGDGLAGTDSGHQESPTVHIYTQTQADRYMYK